MELDVQKAIAKGEEELVEQRAELAKDRLSELSSIYNRFFGRIDLFTNPNEGLDRQIEGLQQQLRIVQGLEAPLTRQAQLENRILELQSQRVGLSDRLRVSLRGIVNELANAAIKAAVLNQVMNALGQGGGTGGFFGIFKTVLGVASLATGNPALGVASAGAGGISAGSGGAPGIRFGGFQITLGDRDWERLYDLAPQ